MIFEKDVFYCINAFVGEKLFGNMAYVCILSSNNFPEKSYMLAKAREFNVSETVFVKKEKDGFYIRWFTPECEVDLCGHGTLAVSYVIFCIFDDLSKIKFHSLSGSLYATKNIDSSITLDFPMRKSAKISNIALFEGLLGFMPLEVYKGNDFYICLFKDENQILEISPCFNNIKAFTLADIIVTAEYSDADFDIVSRVFAPGTGIDEDDVTGSAHVALAYFLNKKTGKTYWNALQRSVSGGELKVFLQDNRVFITGKCQVLVSVLKT
ncbi:MAG: PhzF family phenazine biosynthesis isomerase [Candidatus Muirbacterium halophilum]|nr:PhzF family phenazine biosynthesis isomerase [Candidatus Muirbacterium halophilum]MCK9476506.1 PhzF family phenazine biosynthesis isomerase [Candidatus Muirbacterium halophilum]